MLKLTKTFYKNAEAYNSQKYRYIINQGGSSSSKTFSILQLLTVIATSRKVTIDIASESVPHLKRGVLRDLPIVFEQMGLNFELMLNRSDNFIKFDNGTKINLIALDNPGKARGSRRDILFINEANLIPYETALQLFIRTHEQIFVDYNPTNAFWVHNKIIPNNPDNCLLIKSTYKDNQFLPQSEIDELESRKGDNNFWRVYGLGELGIAEGLVFNNFEQKEFKKDRFAQYIYGVDWGFSNDPFAFVECAIENDNLYICNEVYAKALHNKQAAELIKPICGRSIVTCDSAEPKSISEFQSLGINAIATKKGKGSVESGIKFIQQFKKVYIHPDCRNTFDEFCNYQWKQDKDGNYLPAPVDCFNHAIDAIRYSLENDMNFNKTVLIGQRLF